MICSRTEAMLAVVRGSTRGARGRTIRRPARAPLICAPAGGGAATVNRIERMSIWGRTVLMLALAMTPATAVASVIADDASSVAAAATWPAVGRIAPVAPAPTPPPAPPAAPATRAVAELTPAFSAAAGTAILAVALLIAWMFGCFRRGGITAG